MCPFLGWGFLGQEWCQGNSAFILWPSLFGGGKQTSINKSIMLAKDIICFVSFCLICGIKADVFLRLVRKVPTSSGGFKRWYLTKLTMIMMEKQWSHMFVCSGHCNKFHLSYISILKGPLSLSYNTHNKSCKDNLVSLKPLLPNTIMKRNIIFSQSHSVNFIK